MDLRKVMFDESGHLTPCSLNALKNGSLEKTELISAIEHISHCQQCGEVFANSFEDHELIKAPKGFREGILANLSNNHIKKNRDFLLYSLRVGLAVCASLFMIFAGSLSLKENPDINIKAIRPPNLGFVESINMNLKEFSQKILKLEVLPNETKKR